MSAIKARKRKDTAPRGPRMPSPRGKRYPGGAVTLTLVPDKPRGDALELATAERDIALEMLDKLERIIARTGGHMTPEDQQTLREARGILEESGTRKSVAPALWIDH